MSNPATIETINGAFITEVDPDGRLNLSKCLQCGRCSSGCTMRLETDILPHQLNRMAVLGLKDKMLASQSIWTCASCNTCVSRCPMGVDIPTLIDRLRAMAEDAPADVKRIRTFNDTLLASVRRYGRVYEFGMMAAYKRRTRDFFSDLNKLPAMLSKGKMKLFPPKTGGRKAVSGIFSKVRQSRRLK